jgi:uncharacterized RDD family membrane protein YckC
VPHDNVDSTGTSPQAQVPAPSSLASRGDRLLAVIVDIAVALPIVIPVGIYTGEFSAAFRREVIPWPVFSENVLAGWAWFFIVNTYLLKKYGQTVGKRFLDIIRISDYRTEAVPPFWRLLVRIAVPPVAGLLGALGRLFSLVDVLFIFGGNRRCIHDLIAGTRVVKT